MFYSPKWLLVGILIMTCFIIIGIGFYFSKRSIILLENELKLEEQKIREEIRKLKEDVEQLKKEISIKPREVKEIDTLDWKTYRNEEYKFELAYPSKLIKFHSYTARLYKNKDEYYKGIGLEVELANRLTGCSLEIYVNDIDLLPIIEKSEFLDYKILRSENKVYYLLVSLASHAADPAQCASIFNLLYPTFKIIQ
jgi:hypothetical protein